VFLVSMCLASVCFARPVPCVKQEHQFQVNSSRRDGGETSHSLVSLHRLLLSMHRIVANGPSGLRGFANSNARRLPLKTKVSVARSCNAEMVTIPIHTPLLGAIAVASVHGLTDFKLPPLQLAPYALMFAPIPTHLVTVLFLLASIQHFSRDIGLTPSVALHAIFLVLGLTVPQAGWSVFAMYYCLCHAPLHHVEHFEDKHTRLGAAILAIVASFALGMCNFETFELTDIMQLAVTAHIVVDERRIATLQKGGAR